MGYEFLKLYADLIAPDGTACITYFSWVRLLGMQRGYGGVELYRPDGTRKIFHARQAPAPLNPDDFGRRIVLRLELDCGPYELSCECLQAAWSPDQPPPDRNLEWSVKVARAAATARWTGEPEMPDLAGVGYMDWVSLTRFTRRIGLKTLQWGRAHLPDSTVVFNSIDFKSGRSWQSGLVWTDGAGPQSCSKVEIELDQGAGRVLLPGAGRHPAAGVRLEPQRVLHAGSAFDPERIPGRFERFVCWAIGGRTTEKRWISRANPLSSRPGDVSSGESGWALSELVHFG